MPIIEARSVSFSSTLEMILLQFGTGTASPNWSLPGFFVQSGKRWIIFPSPGDKRGDSVTRADEKG
jgi:hypothetical protein